MFSYIIGLLACVVFFYNPLMQMLSTSPPRLIRTSRPPLNHELLALESPNETSLCKPDAYRVHVFSREPLVLYIEDFLTPDERQHLLEISAPIYEPSTITHDGGDSVHRDATVRDSEVAVIPRTSTVRCIEDRARSVQGWRDEVWLERLRVQRYGPSGHYSHHFDWSRANGGWGRSDSRWCAFVDCPADGQQGVVFRPLPGNAVYWENFRSDGSGRGFQETWHAGLPVVEGIKVGLNIWSWGRLD
ncbi:hypothetical protein B0T18DRAFT_334715 [Schizothecium vesticola]|uniref:Prolyl 4-hydroxylase alpha subunit domain-containing protein n=1 Tax=Schizothecium vesticola TaxID=314040 RepID=A0AA40BQK4_9PEZI|nr:hypothetical protein B0T18DRAFT_334715 [Schizothecium vesticola]